MDEYGIRALIGEVTRGRLSRRQFVETLVGFGLTAPMAAQILAHAGVAQAQPKAAGPAPLAGAAAARSSCCTGRRRRS